MKDILVQTWHWLIIGMFCVMLFLPMLQAQTRFFHEPILTEKRELTQKPPFDFKTLWSFPEKYEAYFNDHFGFRRLLIEWNGVIKTQIYPESVSPVSKVIIGKDGWLFYDSEKVPDGITINDFFGLLKYSDLELAGIKDYISRIYSTAEQLNIPFAFIMAPNKETVYSEYLPQWMQKKRGQSRMDQITDYLNGASEGPILDARNILKEAKTICPTYFKTDTHWNQFGALLAYQMIMMRLSRKNPAIIPYQLSDFELTPKDKNGGDLAAMIGLENKFKDVEILFKLKASVRKKRKLKKIVVFCDSFGELLADLFKLHFENVVINKRPTMDVDVLRNEKPDAAIQELSERYQGAFKSGTWT